VGIVAQQLDMFSSNKCTWVATFKREKRAPSSTLIRIWIAPLHDAHASTG
jgi:hypothetical protein